MQVATDDKGIVTNDSEFINFWALALSKTEVKKRQLMIRMIRNELEKVDPDYGYFIFREIQDRT